jgi:hypothetical protein
MGEQTFVVVALQGYGFDRAISIVETIRDFVSPSRGGISAVPMAMLVTLSSLMKRLRVISATSTAVVIACPRAFRVIIFAVPEENAVMMAST